ncbi:hypothetical protein Tco_0737506 [Tanacetum coccineum]
MPVLMIPDMKMSSEGRRRDLSRKEDLWKEATIKGNVVVYGYSKNHMKTIKNGQNRTRERKSVREPEAKVKKSTLVNS